MIKPDKKSDLFWKGSRRQIIESLNRIDEQYKRLCVNKKIRDLYQQEGYSGIFYIFEGQLSEKKESCGISSMIHNGCDWLNYRYRIELLSNFLIAEIACVAKWLDLSTDDMLEKLIIAKQVLEKD